MQTADDIPCRRIWTRDFHRLERLAGTADPAGLPVARRLLSELKYAIRLDSDRPLTI